MTITFADILSTLAIQGYAELSDIRDAEMALRSTDKLGPVIPLNGRAIQELFPKERDQATSNSFSKRHGLGFFPLHTDTAFWMEPARFVVLFSPTTSTTATRILPLNETRELIKIARRHNPLFLRRTVNGAIYSHPWLNEKGCCPLYDPCYMSPVNGAAVEFKKKALDLTHKAVRLAWTEGKVLVIDNWRVLHGRDKCSDFDRVLYRFYRRQSRELGA